MGSPILKIAFVTDAWPPHVNGVVTTAVNTVDGLRSRGHLVEVFNSHAYRTFHMPSYPAITMAVFPHRRLFRELDAFQPEAVHLAVEGTLCIAGRHWCLRRAFPFTSSVTTRWPEYLQVRTGTHPNLMRRFWRWFHGPAARVMVPNAGMRAELERLGFRNLVLWPRGIDRDLFLPSSKKTVDAPRPISIYLGRVAVEKNLPAFLNLDLPGTKVVIGDGPDLPRLRDEYPGVRFLGHVPHKDIPPVLSSGDVFVFPSRTDIWGNVMLEAMACGLPVAAYPVIGPTDVVVHGRTGWLDSDLKRAVHKALTMDPAHCRQHALRFTWERSVDHFENNLVPGRNGHISNT